MFQSLLFGTEPALRPPSHRYLLYFNYVLCIYHRDSVHQPLAHLVNDIPLYLYFLLVGLWNRVHHVELGAICFRRCELFISIQYFCALTNYAGLICGHDLATFYIEHSDTDHDVINAL